jgi:hypothetical protein
MGIAVTRRSSTILGWVVAGVLKTAGPAAAGDLQQVSDELLD